MLGRDPMVHRFINETIYQAFLSYRHWHAPISRKTVKSHIINGTYYSEPLFTAQRTPTTTIPTSMTWVSLPQRHT